MGDIILKMPKGIPRNQSTQQKLLHRLKIARGHLDKVIKMVESDEYCIDVVHQSMAVQAALKKIDQAVLENHLNHCVTQSIQKGQGKEAIEEIMSVIKKS